VPARLAAQYESATATGHYRRWPTIVVCSGCSGFGCQLCEPEPEPAPTPGRLRRLRARFRKDR
jgi:hypothetical protein